MTPEEREEINVAGRVSDHLHKLGWHFCDDWDGRLIGPGDSELACCTCAGVPVDIKLVQKEKMENEMFDRGYLL